MSQILLFPDPHPLVERLGPEFFRCAPESPGVYLMRDSTDTVLYVGKAKNLRKRLANYRVANPDRLPRRHLRLLRSVQRIELRPCESEATALATEATLLRSLRPRFNRAGTWPGTPRVLAWRVTEMKVDLAVSSVANRDWRNCGSAGAGAVYARAALARLLWCAAHAEVGVVGLPEGWFAGRHAEVASVSLRHWSEKTIQTLTTALESLFTGGVVEFGEWLAECTARWTHPLDLSVREADLETVTQFVQRWGLEPMPLNSQSDLDLSTA